MREWVMWVWRQEVVREGLPEKETWSTMRPLEEVRRECAGVSGRGRVAGLVGSALEPEVKVGGRMEQVGVRSKDQALEGFEIKREMLEGQWRRSGGWNCWGGPEGDTGAWTGARVEMGKRGCVFN